MLRMLLKLNIIDKVYVKIYDKLLYIIFTRNLSDWECY